MSDQPSGEFLLYETEDGKTRVECRFAADTLWLTQALMADLFQVTVPTINEHLKTIFAEGELLAEATIRKFLIVRQEGNRQVSRNLDHYNLDAILAVGYRVRSARGTQFRRWATERLRDYLVKGFTMDDERLKNPPVGASVAPDYFDELLGRIRDIRASERRMYLRVREIFAMAADYSPTLAETTQFFQSIQNKLHYAVTGKTAAELIYERSDGSKPNMGLTSWKSGRVNKTDVRVAKNYLHEEEIDELNRVVVMWLDFAEDQARRRKAVFLKDWEMKLGEFLQFNEREVLLDAGSRSHKQAVAHAEVEYEHFAAQRRAMLEAEGEMRNVQMLEEAAKALPTPARKNSKQGYE
ncbi:hydroxyacid dehydrogenase [Parazoarcus communis]|uniref:Hydroxyacid dehydrogenase n=1 Tax=Parazoarcus communis TaxID=41977 RepID=A0A2U8GRY7_9RHOO|nr:virulence RhuM family protein [Parazoarcus communis]AWI76228.1 hydroxyacid dehydrogenase [Parazoarcus communis]